MSQFDNKKAAALKYDGGSKAPVVVAAGSGYVAQKIIEVAQTNDVPVYQDNSLATLLAQLKVGAEIPPELYQAIVEIYVYFLRYVPKDKNVAPPKPNYEEKQEAQLDQRKLDIVSEPDITIADIPQVEERTYTLDELREENDGMNLDLLENLLEDF